SCVRDLFRKLPKVELRERVAVTGLRVAREGGHPRCVGVTVPAGHSSDGAVIKDGKNAVIEADLIVDASGAVSRAPAWLEAAGLKPPRESVVDPLAGYSSRWFGGPPPGQWPEQWWWWAGAYIRRRPDDLTEANFQLKEHNRWHLTLSGFNRRYPPTHETEFMESLKRMRSPIIDEMTRLMEPISPVYANRAMRNHWRHYEGWNERLDGFIAIGDAFCHYNPVYAQGMTALALSATMLRACLEKYSPRTAEFAREFFGAEARIQHDPWKLSAGVDLRFPFTLGARPFSMKLFNLYLDGVGLAAQDPIVRRRLIEVAQLIRPLSDLFAPAVAGRVSIAAADNAVRALGRLVARPEPIAISPMPPMPPMTPATAPGGEAAVA